MSPSNEDQGRLSVYAQDEATEIWVRDGHSNIVAHEIGNLDARLPPGIYRIRAFTGYQIWEDLVALEPGDAKSVQVPRAQFSSPMPLPDTLEYSKGHESAASEESRRVHVNSGSGSTIFAFIRRYTPVGGDAPRPETFQNPGKGLSIRDMQEKMVADIAAQSAANLGDAHADPWAACNVSVDPGFYRLRLELPSGIVFEQPIIASPRWQTQIFALERSYDSDKGDQWADLPGSSIFYARPGMLTSSDDLRLTELAKLGLIQRRKVLKDDVYDMISGKFENPMLGILGGHLLLLDEKPNYELLRTVVANLRMLLGKHPDVEALALALEPGSKEGSYVFEAPPMLRESWSNVLKETAVRPDLVPQDSLASRVAGRLWGDSPWLLWMNQTYPKAAPPVTRMSASLAANDETAPKLSETEVALVAQLGLTKRANQSKAVPEMATLAADMQGSQAGKEKPKLDDKTAKRLVSILGVPRASLEGMVDDVWKNY